MEVNKRYLIYFNVLLLSAQLICVAEPIPPTTTSPNDNLPEIKSFNSENNPLEDEVSPLAITSEEIKQESETDKSNLTVENNANASVESSDTSESSDGSDAKADSNLDSSSSDEIKSNKSKEDNELGDLQHGGTFETILKTINEDDMVELPQPVDNDENAFISQSEWIEDDDNTQNSEAEVPPYVQALTDNSSGYVQEYLLQGQAGLILIAFLLAVVLSGYVIFVAWRRYIEKRYANREMLVNEEDMIDPSDMKHFSL